MRKPRYPPDDPREWLNRAWSSLVQARQIAPGLYWEEPCMSAQQAAEKAIKSIFIYRHEPFPYTHSIEQLLALLASKGIPIPKEVAAAGGLSRYMFDTRYPGVGPEVTGVEYRRAVDIAEAVVRWAEQIVLG